MTQVSFPHVDTQSEGPHYGVVMDLATIIGIVLSIILVVAAIVMGGSPIMFVNVPSALVVIGGTIGATLMRNPLVTVLGTFGVVMKAFTVKVPEPIPLITQIVQLCKQARKNGMLALENVEIDYAFLGKGVGLGVDGVEPDQIRSILETDIRSTVGRHKRGQGVLEGMGAAAPAFGMIGTLIGLVQMLASMEDPSSIGPAMAIALLTTLYGAILANVICLPLADKLKVRSQEEALSMMVCMEGVLGMVSGENPNQISQKLKSFLAPKLREEEAKGEAKS